MHNNGFKQKMINFVVNKVKEDDKKKLVSKYQISKQL